MRALLPMPGSSSKSTRAMRAACNRAADDTSGVKPQAACNQQEKKQERHALLGCTSGKLWLYTAGHSHTSSTDGMSSSCCCWGGASGSRHTWRKERQTKADRRHISTPALGARKQDPRCPHPVAPSVSRRCMILLPPPHLAVEEHHHRLHGHGAHVRRLAALLRRRQLSHHHTCSRGRKLALDTSTGGIDGAGQMKEWGRFDCGQQAPRLPCVPSLRLTAPPQLGSREGRGACQRCKGLPCTPSSRARMDVKGAASMAALRAGRYNRGTMTCREERDGWTACCEEPRQQLELDPARWNPRPARQLTSRPSLLVRPCLQQPAGVVHRRRRLCHRGQLLQQRVHQEGAHAATQAWGSTRGRDRCWC